MKWRKIKRREGKNETGPEYNVYVLSIDGVDVAEAALTGAYGRDHYPWEWYTLAGSPVSAGGPTDSLASAKREAEETLTRANQD